MTKIMGKLKSIKRKLIHTPVVETPLPDLSIWNMDDNGNPITPVYIESEYIAEQCNEFRQDYRKVILCVTNLKNGNHVISTRKMYNLLVKKWELNDSNMNSSSAKHAKNKLLVTTVCGYIETLLMQSETQYNIERISRSL